MITRKTKIVCSIGPSCDNDETIRNMIQAGMNIARFNFSHGTYEWHAQAMNRVRRISDELDTPVAILLDTKGPEIRTGLVEDGKNVSISVGEIVEITVDDSLCVSASGDKPCHLSLSWKEAPQKLFKDVRILIADGLLELQVLSIENETIICKAKNSGVIGSRKNVNLIGVHAGLPIMSAKDKEDLKFGAEQDVDFVAASFVSFADEIVEIKEYLKSINLNAKVIAKIENEEGLNNINEIVKEADGVMVARGDLGVQLPTERIPLAQKAIIRACRQSGKPVITATQMLDSMINNPSPTRAEISDVANAIFDGTDAVMLSGETANGDWPIEAVTTMATIAKTIEDSEEYRATTNKYMELHPAKNIAEATAKATYISAKELNAEVIIAPTMSGNTAKQISKFRPKQIIFAPTTSERVARQLMILSGVYSDVVDVIEDTDALFDKSIDLALEKGYLDNFEKAVILAGVPNIMKIHTACKM